MFALQRRRPHGGNVAPLRFLEDFLCADRPLWKCHSATAGSGMAAILIRRQVI
jgi:hypothetical protein